MLLSDESTLKTRLQEFAKRKLEAETAEEKLRVTTDDHRKVKAEMDSYVDTRKAELTTAQKGHDRSAAEARSRIQLASQPAAEVLRLKDQNDVKEAELTDREASVRRATELIEKTNSETQKLHDEARQLRDGLRRKHAVLSKALVELEL